ncbi:hypothetical protein [Candidatus Nitrotoga arctica]|uniref:Uncharacterized protein n=1 Tax=Candidatus Nitrotoga arctica TaxID=453162 RepID=A0ABN8AJX7_9PROT|nr:hypothetical protein [Candidatus Nitrotoga arctica]CAG9933054.1 protein of unknown function [Candidatus Nitrotoga arctica]
MSIWSKEDTELAKSLSKKYNEVKTPQEFDAFVSRLESKIETECRAQCDLEAGKKLEDSYQKLLDHVGRECRFIGKVALRIMARREHH